MRMKTLSVTSCRDMEIHEHAVDRYIERVLNLEPEQAGESIRELVKLRIEDTAMRPEDTYHGEEDRPPSHIKGDGAVPVDGSVVPSAYHSKAFRKKMDG